MRDGAERPRPPAIDRAFLERLGRHLGPDTLSELVADGVIEIDDRLRALERAAADGKRERALALAHDLTGLAGHLGLSALSAEAAALQRRARSEPETPADRLAEPVLAVAPEAEAALRAWLSEKASAS